MLFSLIFKNEIFLNLSELILKKILVSDLKEDYMNLVLKMVDRYETEGGDIENLLALFQK